MSRHWPWITFLVLTVPGVILVVLVPWHREHRAAEDLRRRGFHVFYWTPSQWARDQGGWIEKLGERASRVSGTCYLPVPDAGTDLSAFRHLKDCSLIGDAGIVTFSGGPSLFAFRLHTSREFDFGRFTAPKLTDLDYQGLVPQTQPDWKEFPGLTSLRWVVTNRPAAFQPIPAGTRLRELTVGLHRTCKLNTLGNIGDVTTLQLFEMDLRDAMFWSQAKSVEEMYLRGNRLPDVPELPNPHLLRRLYYDGDNDQTDPARILAYTNLSLLTLSGKAAAFLPDLAQLPNLERLFLLNASVTNLAMLGDMPALTSLSVGPEGLTAPPNLDAFPRLEYLNVHLDTFPDISRLQAPLRLIMHVSHEQGERTVSGVVTNALGYAVEWSKVAPMP